MYSRMLKQILSIVICVLIIGCSLPLQVFADSIVYDENSDVQNRCYGLLPDEHTPVEVDPLTYSRSNTVLPSSFDISTSAEYSKYLPPVGDQGQCGSCASFSSTYYHFTYEMAKLKDWDTSTANHRFSPLWPYMSLTDGNKYSGTSYEANYDHLKYCGAITEDVLNTSEGIANKDFQNWYTDIDNMKNALSYRVKSYHKHDVLADSFNGDKSHIISNGVNDDNLKKIKQRIAQGYVVPIGCGVFEEYIQKEVTIDNKTTNVITAAFCPIITDKNDNLMVKYSNHAVTIIGYDDTIECDINGDGKICNNEKGAFKVINSWGANQRWDGYNWIMYEAMNADVTYEIKDEKYTLENGYIRYPMFCMANYNLNTNQFTSYDYSYYTIEVTDEPPVMYAEVTVPPSTEYKYNLLWPIIYDGNTKLSDPTPPSNLYYNKYYIDPDKPSESTCEPQPRIILMDVFAGITPPESLKNIKVEIYEESQITANVKLKCWEGNQPADEDALIDQDDTVHRISYLHYYTTKKFDLSLRNNYDSFENNYEPSRRFVFDSNRRQIRITDDALTPITPKDIQNGFLGGKLRVYDQNGRELSKNEKLGTGYVIKHTCGNEVFEELSVVKFGDVTGDSNIDFRDYYALYDHLNEGTQLQNEYLFAGVFSRYINYYANYNESPTSNDADLLKTYLESNDTSGAVFPDGTYNLRCLKNTEMMMEAYGFGYENGTVVHLNYYTNNNNQKWSFQRQKNGYYIISPEYHAGMALTNDNGSIVLNQLSGNANQQWGVVQYGSGVYAIVPRGQAELYLGNDWAIAGYRVELTDQYFAWFTTSLPSEYINLPDGTYRIQNAKSELYMDGMTLDNTSKTFKQEAYMDDNRQIWDIRSTGDGYYTIAAAYNPGLYVTALGGNNIRCELRYAVASQGGINDIYKWLIACDSNGNYRFISKAYPGHSIAVFAALADAGEDLVLFADNRTENSKWIITAEERHTLPNDIYTFTNVNSGHALDIHGVGTDAGLGVMQNVQSKTSSKQCWMIQYVSDGYYTISSFANDRLHLKAISGSAVKVVSEAQTCAAADDSMLWAVLKNSDGSYRISPKAYPNKAAVVIGALTISGAEVILFDDNMSKNGWWKIEQAGLELDYGMYKIQNRYTGYGIGLSPDNQSVVQYGTSETAVPAWYVVPLSGYSEIRITSMGGTISVGDDGVSVVYDTGGSAGDKSLWFIDADGRIRSKAEPNKVLSVKDDIKLDNIPLVLTDIGTSQSEIWTFMPSNV